MGELARREGGGEAVGVHHSLLSSTPPGEQKAGECSLSRSRLFFFLFVYASFSAVLPVIVFIGSIVKHVVLIDGCGVGFEWGGAGAVEGGWDASEGDVIIHRREDLLLMLLIFILVVAVELLGHDFILP